jgi:hypothetical protein
VLVTALTIIAFWALLGEAADDCASASGTRIFRLGVAD